MEKFKDKIQKIITYIMTIISIMVLLILIFEIIKGAFPALKSIGIFSMLNPKLSWRPVSKNPEFSFLPMLLGTIYVSSLGVVLSLIFGLALSIFVHFYMDERMRKIIVSFIDMLAGVPSVIFGFVGLSVLVKFFTENFRMTAGQCVLAGSIVLSVMLLPFIVSNLSESILRIRKEYELAFLSLGLTKELFIKKILIFKLQRGILSAVILAFGRAIGETIAVMMVIGNSPIYPKLLGRAQTIPALTALEMGNVEYGSLHLSVLYTANLILLILLIVLRLLARVIKKRELYDEG